MSKTFDRYASVIFLLMGAFFIFESRKISASAYGSVVGPDIFPAALGVSLILMSIRLLFETLKYTETGSKKSRPDYKRFLVILASAGLYVAFLEPLGYVMTTFLFLFISFQIMERGNFLKSILVAGSFSFGVYYIFVELLQGSLPGFPI